MEAWSFCFTTEDHKRSLRKNIVTDRVLLGLSRHFVSRHARSGSAFVFSFVPRDIFDGFVHVEILFSLAVGDLGNVLSKSSSKMPVFRAVITASLFLW